MRKRDSCSGRSGESENREERGEREREGWRERVRRETGL